MTTLDKIRELIPDITAAEKAELVQWIVRDIGGVFPGIECRTGVMGVNHVLYARASLYGFWRRPESSAVAKRTYSGPIRFYAPRI